MDFPELIYQQYNFSPRTSKLIQYAAMYVHTYLKQITLLIIISAFIP